MQGEAAFSAGNKLNLGTVETENKEYYVPNANNYYKLDQKQEIGSQLNVTGNVDLVGKSAVEMRGVSVTSNGTVNVMSEGNIAIQEARNQERLSSASKNKSRGLVNSTTEIRRHNHNYDLAEGSTLDADKINLHSGKGNVTVQGSNVVAENGLTVQAKNIDIKEAENRVYSDDFYSKKKSGMLDGGIGITFGSQKQTTEADQTKYYASGSQVGSLNGNTTLIADNHYTQTASAVSAVKGDVNILAKQATIQAADDKYETHTKQTFEQKGLTIAITSPILSALQAVQGTVQSAEKTGKSKNDRVNAMAAANAGMDAYRAGQAVGQAHKAVSDFMNGSENIDSVVGIQITYGQQKSVSKTHTEGSTASTSQVNAGGKVNIVATGAGKASNINIKGADVSGKQGTTLIADNDINITAAEQHHKERSTNKSSGFNAGVAIKVSNGVAAGITVGGNYGKGYGNGDETTYVASHVGDANSQTTIQAGGDANLIGSQLKGKQIQLEAQNLNIESLQDKSTYKGKQMNVAGSVTVGYGFAASGSYSQSKINADHASVNEQAGIYAGDEGYNINVNKHTDLKGAIITSTQQAEDNGKNQFTTGSLTHSDIENHSNYSGSSFGVSGSMAANFETPLGKDAARQSSKQATDKDGNALYTDKNGNTTVSATDANGKSNKAKAAEGLASVQTNYGIGYGSDSESQSSTTKSGINTQNIRIKDEAEQLKRTDKTARETIAAIKTDITTDNAEAQSGKLTNSFDKDKVQKELDLQRDVTQQFSQNMAMASGLIVDKLSEASRKKKYEAAVELENAKKALKENDSEINRTWEEQAQANFDTANREAKEWETGGSQRRILDSALNVVSTFLAGRPAAEVVASGLSPTINHQIKKVTTDKNGNVNTAANLTAHAIWGAVEAYAGNRNVAAGATGAVAGEAAAGAISQLLYDKSPDKLTQDEKLTVSTLSQAAASIAGGALANNTDGAIIAAKTAKDAVENNELSIRDNERVSKLEENLNKRGYLYPTELEEAKKLLEKSDLVDFLRSEEQKNKGKTHPELKKYLDAYLSEIAWDIVHMEAKNGVRVTHEDALKRLYEVDLSKQMKPYYPTLENAIAKDKVLNDNWSRKLEKSNLEAIALFGGPGASTALVKGVAAAENAAANVGGKALVSAAKAESQLNKVLPVVDEALTKAYVNGQFAYADIVGKGLNGAREYVRNGVKTMGEQKGKVVLANALAAGAVKSGFESYGYIVDKKPMTSENLWKSATDIGYSFSMGGATTGMPILPAVGLGVTVDWAKENGKYDAVKTTGGNIVGSMIDAKTGGGLVTPYLRELGTNVFDRYYDSLKKENNNEKNDFIEVVKMSFFLIFMAYLYSLYKFDFDFGKVNILSILKYYPISFLGVLVSFYLGRFLKNI